MGGMISRFGAMAEDAPQRRWWVLAAVEVGNFVVYMDAFIVALALPSMARDFGVGLPEVKWVMLAYMVSLTVVLLLAGRLGDSLGRKTVTCVGMALLTAGAGLAFVAPSLALLVACRVGQGVGGALVLANVMAEITATFPKTLRRRAMAYNASVLAVGQVAGLLLGGLLIEVFGWRSIFLFIALLSVVGLGLDLLILRNRPAEDTSRLDWLGALLSLLVVGAPFLVIEQLSGGLKHLWAWLGLGVTLVTLFALVEWRQAAPLVDLRLFRVRAFVCSSLSAGAYFVAASSGYFLMPLYAQDVLGLTPFQAGLLMLPLSVALVTTSQVVGSFSKVVSPRVVASLGLLALSAAVLGLSCLGPDSSFLAIGVLLALMGVGGGLFQPLNNTSVLAGVPTSMLGMANGFFTASRNFGQAIGVSLAAALLGAGMAHTGAGALFAAPSVTDSAAHLTEIYRHAQAAAFHVAAACGLAGAIISALRGPPILTAAPVDLKG